MSGGMSDPTDLRALLAAATPGPWDYGGAPSEYWAYYLEGPDADLIIAAVNALPDLLDERDRLRAGIEALPVLMREMFGSDITDLNITDLIDRAAVLAIIRAIVATEASHE